MSSTNGLGQADITALLLTGRTLDALSTADAAFVGTQVIGNLPARCSASPDAPSVSTRCGSAESTGRIASDTSVVASEVRLAAHVRQEPAVRREPDVLAEPPRLDRTDVDRAACRPGASS